jgi:hypothetical protein
MRYWEPHWTSAVRVGCAHLQAKNDTLHDPLQQRQDHAVEALKPHPKSAEYPALAQRQCCPRKYCARARASPPPQERAPIFSEILVTTIHPHPSAKQKLKIRGVRASGAVVCHMHGECPVP